MRKIAGLLIAFAILVVGVNLGLRRGSQPVAQAVAPAVALKPEPGALCVAQAPGHFKDPSSVKINGMEPVGTTGPNGGTLYVLHINAKNSYGGYTGETAYFCELGARETQVLSFQEVGPRG